MGLGREMPDKIAKADLANIIRFLCKMLNWIEQDDKVERNMLKLNASALQILRSELQPFEWAAIRLMGLGREMPGKITKDLMANIIWFLCKMLNWLDEADETEKCTKIHTKKVISTTKMLQ